MKVLNERCTVWVFFLYSLKSIARHSSCQMAVQFSLIARIWTFNFSFHQKALQVLKQTIFCTEGKLKCLLKLAIRTIDESERSEHKGDYVHHVSSRETAHRLIKEGIRVVKGLKRLTPLALQPECNWEIVNVCSVPGI